LQQHEIPTIDLRKYRLGNAEQKKQIVRQWDEAFRTTGFCTITGSGVPADVVEGMYEQAIDFFKQSCDEKMKCCKHKGYGSGGFVPMGIESVARSTGSNKDKETPFDLVENIAFSNSGDDPDLTPALPVPFKPCLDAYWAALRELLETVMEISALALDLPADFFDVMYATPSVHLRIAHYPAQIAESAEAAGAHQRYGAHTDYQGFTLLRQDSPGLEVLFPDGCWAPVAVTPHSFIVNAGDLIQRWTNDVWRSNTHRVVNMNLQKSRLSMVFFTGPSDDTLVTPVPTCVTADRPVRYEPINALDHLLVKLNATNV
jgi:isopenicillin N synthase-like dioxygenase